MWFCWPRQRHAAAFRLVDHSLAVTSRSGAQGRAGWCARRWEHYWDWVCVCVAPEREKEGFFLLRGECVVPAGVPASLAPVLGLWTSNSPHQESVVTVAK